MKQLLDVEDKATKSSTLISMLLKYGQSMDQADFFTLLEIASDLSCDVSGSLIEHATSLPVEEQIALSSKRVASPASIPASSIFPQRLKQAMKAAGLTQKELAERAGVSQSVISRLITGKDKSGTRSGVLSHALGVNLDWLHYGTGEMFSSPKSSEV